MLALIAGALNGCATQAPPRVAAPTRPAAPPAPARLAVLPADPLLFADVAAALDQRLGQAQVGGVATPSIKAKLSMEVAQLSLECVSPTDDCYAQVGKFLQVDRLLWGQIVRDPRRAGLTVTVEMLDVARGVALARAEESYDKNDTAIEGLQKLVERVVGSPPKPASTTPRPAAAPAAPGAASPAVASPAKEHAP